VHVLDSRELPELGWEESCEAWRTARRMLDAWLAQVADSEPGRQLRYLDLDLLPLFADELMALAYPVVRTCARLDAAVGAIDHLVVRDDGSITGRTMRAYARTLGIPMTVCAPRSPLAWLRPRGTGIGGTYRWLRRHARDARLRWQRRSLPRPADAGIGILALLGHGTYATSALPVLDFLRPCRRIHVVALNPEAGSLLARRGWPSTVPADEVHACDRPAVRQARQRLRGIARWLLDAPEFLAVFRHRDVNLAPVARPVILSLLHTGLPGAIPVIEGLQTLIRRERPRIILCVPDRNWISRAAIELGHQGDIPSLTIQAGPISAHPRYDTIVADREAVLGESSRRLWEAHGIPGEKLVVTGSPRFAAPHRPDPAAIERVRAVLGLPCDEPMITFATQPLSPTVIERNVRCIVEAANRFPDHHLVCKVHPNERPAYYRKLLRRLGDHKTRVVREVDPPALLQASALVVTAFSTLALEAMLFERPVLIVNLTGEPDPVDYVGSGAAMGAYTPEEVVRHMERLVRPDDPIHGLLAHGRRRCLAAHLHKTGGQATRRVVDLMDRMISAADTGGGR
jgi:hypothetical protein